jgi:uncharacterized protein (DUF608 family)
MVAKAVNKEAKSSEDQEHNFTINTKEELKTFLHNIYDKLTDGTAAPIYCLTAINHALSSGDIYSMLDEESKELARNIWLRLKAAGMQVRNPPVLFGIEEEAETA